MCSICTYISIEDYHGPMSSHEWEAAPALVHIIVTVQTKPSFWVVYLCQSVVGLDAPNVRDHGQIEGIMHVARLWKIMARDGTAPLKIVVPAPAPRSFVRSPLPSQSGLPYRSMPT